MEVQRDWAANQTAAIALIEQAAQQEARLVVLPEMWLGLRPSVRNQELRRINEEVLETVRVLAARLGLYVLAGSILELGARGQRYNTSFLLGPSGDVIANYRKMHLFDVSLPGLSYVESRAVSRGDQAVTVQVDEMTVGLAICYDLRFPELFRELVLAGADVVVLPSAFTTATGKDHWEVLLRARAIENQVYVVAANQLGPDAEGIECYGHSMVVDPWGTALVTAPPRATVIVADISVGRLRHVRATMPVLEHRAPTAYERLGGRQQFLSSAHS